MMLSRRMFVGSGVMAGLAGLSGCGWAPLYADRETGPADAELAAIKVAPIPERAGQILALGLRQWLNPSGAPVPSRYLLRTLLTVSRLDLGILTFGLGTRARLDVLATFTLYEIATSTPLLTASSHASESFDIVSNYYSNVVAEESARARAVEEIRRDIVTQLTVFLQRRAATAASQP
jgi:LPS-assembly lipoprotein